MRFHHAVIPLGVIMVAACSGNVSETSAASGSGGGQSSSAASGGGAASSASTASSSGSASSASTASSSSASSGAGGGSSSASSSGAGGGSGIVAELKAGPWMFGWSGGLDHYSWVRFNFTNATQGSVDVLGAVCPSCAAYWQCDGKGIFSVDPMTSTVTLQLPQACNNMAHTLVITMLMPPGPFPKNATSQASVTDDGKAIMGFQFPPAQCDAQFTTCQDPFQ